MGFEFERFDEIKKSKWATKFFCIVLPITLVICLVLAVAAIAIAQPKKVKDTSSYLQQQRNATAFLKEKLEEQMILINALNLKLEEQERRLNATADQFYTKDVQKESVITALKERLGLQEFALNSLTEQFGSQGAVYTRWGRDICGDNSTRIYKGVAGGTDYNHTGGGVNYQCLPESPEYNKFSGGETGTSYGSLIYGVEYRSGKYGIFPDAAHGQNAPCARCHTNKRTAVMMLPSKRTCPDEWTMEYEGYLMTSAWNHAHPTTYECVDASPQYVSGQGLHSLDAFFYFVRSSCDGVPCPPYTSDKELTCVVCSK